MGKQKPFSFLFAKLTPAEFATAFRNEAAQTRAFILSFADFEYINDVSNAYKSEEFADLLTEYLNRLEGSEVSKEFIRRIEVYVKKIFIDGSRTKACVERKNIILKNKKEGK